MLLVLALLIVAVAILYEISSRLFIRLRTAYKRAIALQAIPCGKRHWFYGNGRYFSPDEAGMQRELESLKRFPKCLQKWLGPMNCVAVIHHPDTVERFLKCSDRKGGSGFLRPWIGDGLLSTEGEKWKRNRRLLTPIFHFEALKRYLPCVNDATEELMGKWTAETQKSREMFQDVSLMALDSLLRCMFSKRSGCETGENKRYLNAVTYLCTEVLLRQYNPFYSFDFIYYRSSAGRRYKQELEVAHNFTEKAIQERQNDIENGRGHKHASEFDFLDVLLMARDENGTGLSHREIRDELDTFVFAGHDTVTSAISWAFYNLALYPEQQELCRNEVSEVLKKNSRVEWQHLPRFQYLTKFIKESLRMFPSAVQFSRKTNQSMWLPDDLGSEQSAANSIHRELPRGTRVAFRLFSLHRNPSVWKDPDVFDPGRFDVDKIRDRPVYAYLPFAAGKRNCIGQNFAMNEMKVVLAVALSRFKFSVDSDYPNPEMHPSVVLRSKNGIHLLVEDL